ncbi:MAG: glutamine--fructose-6-phosphate transaminase (isomerizing) [Candidatus Niyogibacteria bacterium CG10_big_fil_rev_8_21_14_0_10_46_36]|uniref:Glutamine--fructose-6-phosphate aminotransferase [isomerizing] n=1 Tax=Candidatus Niyogibacteria bacterium CG10_big_fil_rev_8_21_14_0_10_46_36 TaxID=1974726 RepID=A0A2H0TD04_9BACT|nr:MAG: glutamine--fructose-6-phosphate transaminase (isomerizing) [Candidatus Niyogibacteria bacterium CG10_big_fil_rev_8_21_14_0_10_46_36]
MCGIVGYIGKKDGLAVVTKGLERLEYRGYDSAGVAFLGKRSPHLRVVKTVGRLQALTRALSGNASKEQTAVIGHTRWATHGVPTKQNAHPHIGCKKEIAVVHNGIIENHDVLREALVREGHTFRSHTDSEVLVHLIERMLLFGAPSLEDALRQALHHVRGTFGIAAFSSRWPDTIVAARRGSPLLVGIGKDGEYVVASDASAIAEHTKQVLYLNDNEMVSLSPAGHRVFDIANNTLTKSATVVDWTIEESQKGGFPHFMLKEIHEIPEVIQNALRGRVLAKENSVKLGGLEPIQKKLASIQRVIIVACGTSYYAGLIGKYLIERMAKLPVEVVYASEFRYAPHVIDRHVLVIAISQSGETADTLEAVKEAKRERALTLGIVNVVGSSIAREVHAGIYNHAGPEIAVASTKAFVSQLAVLALFSAYIGEMRNTFSEEERKAFLKDLLSLPHKCKLVLKESNTVKKIAKKFHTVGDVMFLGRKYNWPTALEGSLKLKEISYIHAEGYPAGEIKHGPIALIDANIPTIVIALKDSVYEKTVSAIQEIRARKGPVIAVASVGDDAILKYTQYVMFIPQIRESLSPMLAVIPLQLFAYYVSVFRGTDVDKPRNLAKSVTVE